ncbi:MAG: GNAT family N-acetyltransferase [Promethearchaeota archaeon]
MSEQIENEIIVRNYRTSDFEETLEILKHLQTKYDIGLSEDIWRESSGLRQFKPNLKRITLIAEDKNSGEVVGMGVIEAKKDSIGRYIGYLENWATKPDYIGRGVGKILAEKATNILKSWGCYSIRINLGYDIASIKKLIHIMSKNMGFKPIFIVLEKKFENEKK